MVLGDYLDDYLVTTDDMMNSTQTGIKLKSILHKIDLSC